MKKHPSAGRKTKVGNPHLDKPGVGIDEIKEEEEFIPMLNHKSESLSKDGFDRAATSALERQNGQAAIATQIRPGQISPVLEVRLDPARLDPHLVALHDYDSRAAGRYAHLAVSLMAIADQRNCRRVLVASARHREGRTCVTLNLAGALARARQRVLVIDGDLQRPSTLRLLGIDAEAGLTETVGASLKPEAAIIKVLPVGFHVLGTRAQIPNPLELLTAPELQELLQIFDRGYDYILFDSPPLLAGSEALLLRRLTDATLLVIRPGWARSAEVAKALALFNKDDLCGVVLNRIAS
jgi:capsular exopolysaccharide synthesis family protein